MDQIPVPSVWQLKPVENPPIDRYPYKGKVVGARHNVIRMKDLEHAREMNFLTREILEHFDRVE